MSICACAILLFGIIEALLMRLGIYFLPCLLPHSKTLSHLEASYRQTGKRPLKNYNRIISDFHSAIEGCAIKGCTIKSYVKEKVEF